MIDKLFIYAAKQYYSIKDKISEITSQKSLSFEQAFSKGLAFSQNKVVSPFSQNASVYMAIKATADNAAQVETELKTIATGEKTKDSKLEALLESPNEIMSGSDFIEACVGYMQLCNECFIIKINSTIGQFTGSQLPDELYPLNPKHFIEKIEKVNGKSKLVSWKYSPTNQTFRPEEVIHVKNFNPNNQFRGLNPCKVIENEIDIAWNSLKFNKAFFKNNASGGSVFITDKPMGAEQRTRFIESVNAEHQGTDKQFKNLLLEGGLDVKPSANTHKDMEFIEQMKYTRRSTFGIFRFPESMASITENINYATSREQSRIFWEDNIIPVLKKIAGGLNRGLVYPYNPKIYIAYDWSKVPAFKEAWKSLMTIAEQMKELNIPFRDINEKLELGLPDQPWYGEPLIPFNLVPISQAGSVLSSNTPDEETNEPAKAIEAAETKQIEFIATEKDKKSLIIWNVFEKIHISIEGHNNAPGFEKAMSSFFYHQRVRILNAVGANKDISFYKKKDYQIPIDWQEEDTILLKKAIPYITLGIEGGFDFAESLLKQGLALDKIEFIKNKLIRQLSSKIVYVNKTTRKRLNEDISKVIESGINEGDTINQIANSIRDSSNFVKSRSLLIARTETTGAINIASTEYYKSAGVQRKEWLTAGDERGITVRDSHNLAQAQGPIAIGEKFHNGLEYPGDPMGGPEEVCNCRCTLVPIV